MTTTRISVVFSTFNRADLLRETLDAMAAVSRDGLSVDFVVINNNSSDHTDAVLAEFAERMPLTAMFEGTPGKNAALNHALDTHEMGDIVVFTDDDIVPRTDWLQRIAAGCDRWPDHSVFGGKIEPIWPPRVTIPGWARTHRDLQTIMFAVQDLGETDVAYVDRVPFGPNFWVRGTVFEGGRRYDDSIGPRPGSYKMGSENAFLLGLVADGHTPMFVHDAVVGHHVQEELLTDRGLVKRYIKSGRGILPREGINRSALLGTSTALWKLRTYAALAASSARLATAALDPDGLRRSRRLAAYARDLGYDLESLNEARGAD